MNWPPLEMVERCGDGDFHAELIGFVRFALGDAFDLRRVQGIDCLAALPLLLMTHRVGQRQQLRESDRLPVRIAGDLAHYVAHHAAKIRAQCLQRPVGAPELFRVSVALMRDQRVLANTLVGLPQDDAVLFGQPRQLLAGAMHEFGVGRERHRLRLHRRIDDDAGEVRRLGRANARGDIQALLNERDDLVFAHALTPARHRMGEGNVVTKERLATKQLIIGVFDPAFAQRLVRQIERVLEDRQPRHQPRRQGRPAGNVGVDRPEFALEKSPVDLARQLRQRVVHVDDLVEVRLE